AGVRGPEWGMAAHGVPAEGPLVSRGRSVGAAGAAPALATRPDDGPPGRVTCRLIGPYFGTTTKASKVGPVRGGVALAPPMGGVGVTPVSGKLMLPPA